jgi:Tfp pilus assembly protein PilW
MTISTIHTERGAHAGTCRAFTLVELIVGSTISSFILAGVMSAFLMLGRSGMNAANYSMSESEVRRAIEAFSRDLRMASNVSWTSETSITLTLPNNYANNSNQVTYAYDSSTSGGTAQCFYRVPADGLGAATATRILVRNISSFAFARYNRLDAAAANNTETKRIQLSLNVRRTGQTLVAANTMLVSASYTLRNKPVN